MSKILFVMFIVLLAACGQAAVAAPNLPRPATVATAPASPVATPTVQVQSNAIIASYGRVGGMTGRARSYTLYADGSVRVGTSALVRNQSQQGEVVQLPGGAAAAAQLAAALDASGLSALPPGDYAPVNACCDRTLYELTLYQGDQQLTYLTVDAANHPEALAAALALVQTYLASL